MLNELVQQAMQNNPYVIGLDDVVEKEILHHHLLNLLHREGFMTDLTFMGGTALRLCYNSNRLSEDLDFAGGEHFQPSQFNGLASHIESYLQNVIGLEVSAREPKLVKGDTSTWKVTIIKYPERPDLPAQKVHLDICACPALDIQYLPVKNHYQIQSPIAGLPIQVESLREILCDNMVAFAYQERRIKPRDVWDLGWLSQHDISLAGDMLIKKLALHGKSHEDFLHKIQKHAALVKNDEVTKLDFHQEMSRFVPPGVAANTLAQAPFWQYLSNVINNYVSAAIKLLSEDVPATEQPEFKM